MADIHLAIADPIGSPGQAVETRLLFRADGRAACEDHAGVARPLEDFFCKQSPQRAKPAGNQVDTVLGERHRRLVNVCRHLLPT